MTKTELSYGLYVKGQDEAKKDLIEDFKNKAYSSREYAREYAEHNDHHMYGYCKKQAELFETIVKMLSL